jgi:hypothetical protein
VPQIAILASGKIKELNKLTDGSFDAATDFQHFWGV